MEKNAEASYEQNGQIIEIEIGDWDFELFYDGERLEFGEGFIPGEVAYIINCDF